MKNFEEGKYYILNRWSPKTRAIKCLKAAKGIGILEHDDGEVFPSHWSSDWREVKPKKVFKGWVNIYPEELFSYDSQQEANNSCGAHRVACKYVEIEYEEGEGL